jgi:zinc protease
VTVRATYVHRPIEQYRVTISFGSDPERADELIRTVFAEIDRLKMDAPTEDQVADVQAGMGRALETNLERNIYWLSQLAFAYQRGVDPGSTLMSARASIEALTVSTLRDVATRCLDTDNFVRATLLPER